MKMPIWMFRWLHRQSLTRHRMRGGRMHSWFGDRLLERSLWTPTRGSLARAWMVGFPITMVPFLPGQSVLAAAAAMLVRGNLLLCIGLQFLSNPLTAPVQLSACYLAGELARGRTPSGVWRHVAATPLDLLTGDAVISLYLGACVVGILGGAAGYAVILGTWRDSHPHKKKLPKIHPPQP